MNEELHVTHTVRPAGSIVQDKDGTVISHEKTDKVVLHKEEQPVKVKKTEAPATKEK
jgi:hypothetical protein